MEQRLPVGKAGSSAGDETSNPTGGLEHPSKMRTRQLGERLRDSLQAEQLRRREIVRITAADVVGDPMMKAATRDCRISGPQSISLGRARPASPSSSRRKRHISPGVKYHSEAEVFDRWTPAVSHIARIRSEDKSSLSSLACIHGLPNPCTPSMIRRFFSGFDTKLYVLLYHPFRIDLLDANHEIPFRKEPRVDRYHPTDLRVLVEFENTPALLLACERSREVLLLDGATIHGVTDVPGAIDGGTDSIKANLLTPCLPKGAAVAVTPIVSKQLARTIRDYVSIDVSAPHHSKSPLHVIESRVRENLDPLAARVLWTYARQVIASNQSRVPTARRDESRRAWNAYPRLTLDPLARVSQLNHAKQGNEEVIRVERMLEALQKDMEQLLLPPNQPLWVVQDPEVLQMDPVTRLTCRAADCLQYEMDKCSQLLAKRRVLEFLSAPMASK